MKKLAVALCLIGFFMFMHGSPSIFSGSTADCGGEPMNPGDRCGEYLSSEGPPSYDQMKSYEEMKEESARNRAIGYAGIPVFAVGAVGLVTMVIRDRRR